MATEPYHIDGTPSLVPATIVASFPVGTFLENIATRSNGTLLVSNMFGGEIFYVDPHATNPQSTVRTVHNFNMDGDTPPVATEEEEAGPYGSNKVAEAIVEDPITADLFYTVSGFHGKAGTWAIWRLDLRRFDPESPSETVEVEKIADVPEAVWLNGATMLPETSTLLIAESLLGKLISCDIHTGTVGVWPEDRRLGKITERPLWPAVNGVQFFRGGVFATVSDQAALVRVSVDSATGKYVEGSLTIVAENLAGDDLDFDVEGTAYVSTNPSQTVLSLPRIAFKTDGHPDGRLRVLGGLDVAETAGPTAVAFGRTVKDDHSIYVTTTGGLLNPVGGGPGLARILRADVGVRGN